MRTLLSFVFLCAAAVAQTAHTTPNPASPQNLDRPFPGGVGHYQQWYKASELLAGFTTPMRFEQVEFFAGSNQSSNATTIDMEVSIGHGNSLGLTGTFASNFSGTPVIVLPRQNVQLLAGGPGAVVMTVPFTNLFTWDHQRPVVIDIKIFGNSRSNQPFVYNLRGTTAGGNLTSRNYVAGNATATSGTVQQGIGLVTRFTARPGVVLDFGSGCAGEGSFVPHNASVNIPYPGVVWNNQITGAASQRYCMLVLGASNTQTSATPPLPLPLDIGQLLGMGTFNCSLLVDPVSTKLTQTVGGGPGSGVATLPIQMPAVTFYIGMSLYTQWLVLDPNAPNGIVSATQGVWSIVAPVGG
ncbi:MAG: hypothetical protein IT456_08975 [Planctomycetes bacterium]|jgi:hypothetical protein|nr:hypothetical protein [Planctomycetota bacterium]